MNARESYLCHLFTGPLLKADAIVILAGEDADARCQTGLELFRNGAAPRIVLSGGRHDPPAIQGADALAGKMLSLGVAPVALSVEHWSQNTREQAVNITEMAASNDWHRVLLVASAYHLPRAFLTFVAVPSPVQWVPVPAYAPWHQCPPGVDRTRAELLLVEGVKVTEYQALGHCASYEAGLDYLKTWEGK
jgi:uncharacterized SAM-binding protein YcdF (DUF218 family)